MLRSSKPIEGASQALRELHARRIPFILLTNGGGKSEKSRVEELSRLLEVPLDTSMFVQSHTPFASLVEGSENKPALKDEPILVVGGVLDNCCKVSKSSVSIVLYLFSGTHRVLTNNCSYGFNNVIIPSDIYHAHPEIWPFSSPFRAYHAASAQPLPLPIFDPDKSVRPVRGGHLRINSIFVYNDPRDLGLDAQLVLDLLLSHDGILGTRSSLNGRTDLPNNGYQQDGQPPLYFANPDLIWAAKWHLPRLGSGGFKAALDGMWAALTGGKATLQARMGGKPHQSTYEFAEQRLVTHRNYLLKQAGEGDRDAGPLKRVYMVGDNPASDIVGANAFRSPASTKWSSILVWSGVFQGEEPEEERLRPTTTVDDVRKAVEWVLTKEGLATA